VVAAAALAGCSTKADGGQGDLQLADGHTVDLEAAARDAGATAAADRGTISGVVVDAAIRPIAAANLTLVGQGVTTAADANGVFVLPNLKPGLFTIQAHAKGFLPVQSTAEVQAGQTTKVRMVMDVDRTPLPFHTPTIKFKGFYTVGSGLADEVQTLEGNRSVGPVQTPWAATCTCVWDVSFDPNATTFVIEDSYTESIQEPSQVGSPEMTFKFDVDKGTDPALIFCYGVPCSFHEWGSNVSKDASKAHIHFWSNDSWVAVNEEFQAFFTVFYVAPAPAGWSFLGGGT